MKIEDLRSEWREAFTDEMFNAVLVSISDSVTKFFDNGSYNTFTPTLHAVVADNKQDSNIAIRVFKLDIPEENKYGSIVRQCFLFSGSEPRPYLCFFLAAPAWHVDRENPDEGGPVSQDPTRKEAIAISGITPDLRVNMSLLNIARHGKKGYISVTSTLMVESEDSAEVKPPPVMKAVVAGYTEGYYEFFTKKRKAKYRNAH